MLLTLTYTPDGPAQPATELGFLLHKHPARVQTFELSFGQAHVYYPEATAERCTAALQLEVDPVALSRPAAGRPDHAPQGRPLEPYVNDRPYVASSFMSVALSEVFGVALQGRSKERPELAGRPLALRAQLAVLSCRGGEAFFRRLFEPLGYEIAVVRHPLDEQHPEWGASRYLSVTLGARRRLCELLGHLYVLIPVLDDDKHYYVGESEVEKLLRYGEGWLAEHPERHQITLRYLKHRRTLAHHALDRLITEAAPGHGESGDGGDCSEAPAGSSAAAEPDRRLSLDEQRQSAVVAELGRLRARRVLDLGCGEAKLLRALLHNPAFTEIVGVDVSLRALQIAADRLRLEQLPEKQRSRITLLHGSLTYRDKRLVGFDAAAVVEVIEHLPPERLSAFERALFGAARPRAVVLTTPNAEYNVRYAQQNLFVRAGGRFRHSDHRFEWTRAELTAWARGVAERHGYTVTIAPIGEVDPELGAPTQLAVFERKDAGGRDRARPASETADETADEPADERAGEAVPAAAEGAS
ncbi:MAG: 3' terminal RNA ribose 2'-O-methyltransferase Hen1 [Polyangia bacterium]